MNLLGVGREKLKINLDQPIGTKIRYDEEDDDPLAASANGTISNGLPKIDEKKVQERYKQERKRLAEEDEQVDKPRARHFRKEQELKQNLKRKRGRTEGEEEVEDEQHLHVDTRTLERLLSFRQ
ncbi:hypothetical protein AKJ16_DCAP16154 [Drosera capensis]